MYGGGAFTGSDELACVAGDLGVLEGLVEEAVLEDVAADGVGLVLPVLVPQAATAPSNSTVIPATRTRNMRPILAE